jgi:RNA polymerase sigma-70 factor (ECF subfamily)
MQEISRLVKPNLTSSPISTLAGFCGLYERSHLHVFRYLFGLTGGPQADVEDLTAETFLRAWKGRHSFRGEEPTATGWLLKIARRLVIDDYRRRKARPVAEDGDSAEPLALDSNPEETVLDRERQAILFRLLRSLADGPREMLVLRYLLGWHVHQIAAHFEIPENTVSVAIRRSLERLRQEWPQPQEK